MIDPLPIQPVSGPIDATVEMPGSKSITNRALILAALADGESRLENALFSDDTRYMANSLNRLGILVEADEHICTFVIQGQNGRIPATEADLFVGNSGTAARFLTAIVALGNGTYRVDGNDRMRERPIRELLNALNELGVNTCDELGTGCPPILVRSTGLKGGRTRLRGDASSQYLSGLLMAAPLAAHSIEIEIKGELSSKPYVDMTLRMMERWDAEATSETHRMFCVKGGQSYRSQAYQIEPDASGASYFFAAAAVTGGRVRVRGLDRDSIQGDLDFVRILEQMGCRVLQGTGFTEVRGRKTLHGIVVDMNAISDTVMTLAAIAPFADSPTTIQNVAHIRHKETDRLQALSTELVRIGVRVDERPDGLTIYPAKDIIPAEIETYDDHRMAMSFAITGLKAPGISIKNPGCVTKTFPDFFERLKRTTCAD